MTAVPAAAPQHTIVVYGHSACPGSRRARRFFQGRGLPYAWRDVTTEPEAAAELAARGAMATPLIVIDGDGFVGFDAAEVERLLTARSPVGDERGRLR